MNFVIVGGGIGGLTAALELTRAGVDVQVLERRGELAEVNTGFFLWSFAIRRLRDLGLGPRLEAIGEPVERLVTKSWRGHQLSELELGSLNRRLGGASYDVHRAGLQALLADALGRDRIELNARCVEAGQDTEHAWVELEGGRRVAADCVVGADGVNSVVRQHVVGEVALRRGDFAVWRGVAEVDPELVPAGAHIRIMGPAGLFGVGRLDDREIRWYAAGGTQRPGPELAARFSGWPEPVPSVLEATDPAAILFNDTPRARPLRHWQRGRVALLGDAAHPTLPSLATGGGMAIEDAASLRESLSPRADVVQALEGYERRRRPAAARVQRQSDWFGRVLAVESPATARVRDVFFGRAFDPVQRRAVARLMRGG